VFCIQQLIGELTMQVVIDGTPAINDIRAIKRYAYHLIVELEKLETELQFNLLYLGVKNKQKQLPQLTSSKITQTASLIPGKILYPSWKYLNFPKASFWIKKPFDLIHFPGGLPYIPTKCKKILTTLHGFHYHLIPELMNSKNSYKTKKELDFSISESTHLITVSEANRTEVMNLWGISGDKIHAIPLGVSPEFKEYELDSNTQQALRTNYNIPDKPFLLFVGALEPHKNIKNIIIAYSLLKKTTIKNYQLVFIGQKTSYSKGFQEQISSLGLSHNVSFIDYIQPGSLDLAYLYNMATIFIFPTFYEGWASPPLEAMKCGTPAIVSDIPSLRESTGGIALYLNPYDPEEIANNIQELLEDKNLYLQQQQKGLEFTKQYTWKRCTKNTLALYERLLKE
jgi:glycosyltransferase involved in cell wall biosynthesis